MLERVTESVKEELLSPSAIPIVILAGGRGQRLGEVTRNATSKLLVPTSTGQTLLDLTVGVFRAAGARNLILSVAHRKEQVVAYCQNHLRHLGLKISDQGSPEGIPDAVLKAIRETGIRGDFIACDGDGIRFGLDLPSLIETHITTSALATIAAAVVEDPSPHYALSLDEENRVLDFIKFPQTGPALVHTGLILFSEEAIPLFGKPRADKAWDSIYEDLLSSGRLYAHIMPQVDYFNVNTPEALRSLDDYLLGTK